MNKDNRNDINPMEAIVLLLGERGKAKRAKTQMTLGDVIKFLESIPEDSPIKGLGKLHSYRGFYSDISFEPTGETRCAEDILEDCRKAMGRAFTGYKGGENIMGEYTPVWVAPWGMCGKKLMAIGKDGELMLADYELEDA